jgi:hypothetical protein
MRPRQRLQSSSDNRLSRDRPSVMSILDDDDCDDGPADEAEGDDLAPPTRGRRGPLSRRPRDPLRVRTCRLPSPTYRSPRQEHPQAVGDRRRDARRRPEPADPVSLSWRCPSRLGAAAAKTYSHRVRTLPPARSNWRWPEAAVERGSTAADQAPRSAGAEAEVTWSLGQVRSRSSILAVDGVRRADRDRETASASRSARRTFPPITWTQSARLHPRSSSSAISAG